LGDLAGTAHDLGCHKNEQESVRIEYDRGIERSKKASHRDGGRQSRISESHRLELD
jgi:hypothetical protein